MRHRHSADDLGMGVQQLTDAIPGGVLLGSGQLATVLDRLELIDEYHFLVHPRIAGHGPTRYQRAAQHATSRVGLGLAAAQRRQRWARPAGPLVTRRLRASRSVGQWVRVSARYGKARGAIERGGRLGCGGGGFGVTVRLSTPGRTRFAKGSVKTSGSHSHVVKRMRERKPGQ